MRVMAVLGLVAWLCRSACGAEVGRLRGEESGELRWQAVEVFEASEQGDVLSVRVHVGGVERAWELQRVTGLYAKASQAVAHGGASFKVVRPGEGWAVAHRGEDGAVHGSWFSAADGATWEFSSASRLSQLLTPGASGRALADASGASVLAASSASAPRRCGEAPVLPELDSAVEEARAAGDAFLAEWQSDPRWTPPVTPPSDPLQFWGRGTCFPDDYNTHTFSVGLMLHSSFVAFYGSSAKARAAMEAAFVSGSIVFEYQFNVRLQLGEVMDVSSAPSGAVGLLTSCPGSSVLDALGAMSPVVAKLTETQGVWSLLTNCYPPSQTGGGIMGVANMGTSGCGFQSRGWNIGVVNTSPGLWRTLAHELGHGFNMKHSFESGVGTTGGLMDYGNPLVDGKPRFRSERAKEACSMFSSLKANRCAMLTSTGQHQTPPPTQPFPTKKPTKGPPGVPTPKPATPAPTAFPATPGCAKGQPASLFLLSDAGSMCARQGQRLCTVAELKNKNGICTSAVYWTSQKCNAGGNFKYVAATKKASCVTAAASKRRTPLPLKYAAVCCAQ